MNNSKGFFRDDFFTTMALTNFDDSDWDAYSGCETTNPLICAVSMLVEIDGKLVGYDGCLVVDGNAIEIDLGKDHEVGPGEHQIILSREFKSQQDAIIWVNKANAATTFGPILVDHLVNNHSFKKF